MPGKQFGVRKPYLSIVQGNFHQKVDELTENAVKRDYELKDGTKGTKWELVFQHWYGVIRNLSIKDGKFGETLEVEFDDAIVVIGVQTRYFSDFVKRLRSANINQEVILHPYDFEMDGRKLKGISIEQGGEKVKNYYWNEVDKTVINGFPQTNKPFKSLTKREQTAYFLAIEEFLAGEIEVIKSQISREVSEASFELPSDDNEPDNSDIREDEVVGFQNSEQYEAPKPAVKEEPANPDDVPF